MPRNFSSEPVPVILSQNPPKTEEWLYRVTIRRVTRKGEGTTYEVAVDNPPPHRADQRVNELVLNSLNETFAKQTS